jgi:hypothetical protein
VGIQTEYSFNLPKGYTDENGNLNRKGTMRLATAADEILPLKDPRVKENPAYLTVILLSRVIIKLGDLPKITPRIVEGLFASDLAYLKKFYNRINGEGIPKLKVKCPHCGRDFETYIGGFTITQTTLPWWRR